MRATLKRNQIGIFTMLRLQKKAQTYICKSSGNLYLLCTDNKYTNHSCTHLGEVISQSPGLSPFWEIIPEEEENNYIQEQRRNDMLPQDDDNDMQTHDEVKGSACMLKSTYLARMRELLLVQDVHETKRQKLERKTIKIGSYNVQSLMKLALMVNKSALKKYFNTRDYDMICL